MYNNYGFPYSMPTATQPYGVPMFPQQAPSAPQQTPNASPLTNKIYVTGIDGARQYQLPNGSDYVFLDNDKAMIYRKTVDATGKMDVQAFDITPHAEPTQPAQPEYALKSDLDALRKEIASLKGGAKE